LKKSKKNALARLDNKEFLEKALEYIVQEHKARIAKVDLNVSGIKYAIKNLESI
jgi:valyl-tRNA synthetase